MRIFFNKRFNIVLWASFALVFVIFLSFLAIHVPRWEPWTGINGKTAWDLMDLLIIPILVAVIAILFSREQYRIENQIELDRQREAALQMYFDRMQELIVNKHLQQLEVKSEAGYRNTLDDIARGLVAQNKPTAIKSTASARTLSVLRLLDGERKGMLVRFICESNLITSPIVTIRPSVGEVQDLRRSIEKLNRIFDPKKREAIDSLTEADLKQADLTLADLEEIKWSLHNSSYAVRDLTKDRDDSNSKLFSKPG